MPKERPDFITVRISDAALHAMGTDAQVRYTNAHAHYVFTGATPVEVLRREEWAWMRLSAMPDGTPLFQESDRIDNSDMDALLVEATKASQATPRED